MGRRGECRRRCRRGRRGAAGQGETGAGGGDLCGDLGFLVGVGCMDMCVLRVVVSGGVRFW